MSGVRALAVGMVACAVGLLLAPAAHADLPGIAPPGTGTQAAPAETSAESSIAVETSVVPTQALPGQQITQTARITNTGIRPASRIVVQLDAGPDCRWLIPILLPGNSAAVTCEDTARGATATLRARARGSAGVGRTVHAVAGVQIELLVPAGPQPVHAPPAAQAPPLPPPPVQVPVAVAVAPPAAVPAVAAPAPADMSFPASRTLPDPPVRTVGETGPLVSPARTAGLVAILSAMMMTVTVGALAAAIRVR